MNRDQVQLAKETEEQWITTGQGTIYVNTTNLEGRTVSTAVGGRPEAILRITTYDRLRNQETTVDRKDDPFTNGMLIRTDADQQADPTTKSPDAMNDQQVIEVFGLDKPQFREFVSELGEYSVRRLLEKCEEVDATTSQKQLLEDLVQKWAVGGSTPMYEELKKLGQVATADR